MACLYACAEMRPNELYFNNFGVDPNNIGSKEEFDRYFMEFKNACSRKQNNELGYIR